jgi:hypothetical protein
MTTATSPSPDVAPPPGFDAPDEWEPGHILSRDETRAWRLIYWGSPITDHKCGVTIRTVQYSDGDLDDDISISVDGASFDDPLNSDEARELASALLEAAAERDRLVAVR